MTLLDHINLASSLASLILSLLAIWLALHFYDKAKNSEKQTEVNVNEIKIQTKALTDISSRMLDKYTDYATKPKAADESFLIIAQLLGRTTATNLGDYSSSNIDTLRPFAVGAAIAAMYYAGLANMALQDLLPENKNTIEETNNLPQLLDASSQDFAEIETMLSTIDQTTISSSEVENLYQIALGWKGNSLIRNMEELYSTN